MDPVLIAACTGGLAGGIVSTAAAPVIQAWLQRRAVRASLRQNAIQDLKSWTAKAYELYMATEATWIGGNRPSGEKGTLADPLYAGLRNAADLSIKTAFEPAQYESFKAFANWLERKLSKAFESSEIFPFEEFHARQANIVNELLGRLY
jgi:hypothetical protein